MQATRATILAPAATVPETQAVATLRETAERRRPTAVERVAEATAAEAVGAMAAEAAAAAEVEGAAEDNPLPPSIKLANSQPRKLAPYNTVRCGLRSRVVTVRFCTPASQCR